jgi:hypothetical protein
MGVDLIRDPRLHPTFVIGEGFALGIFVIVDRRLEILSSIF